MVEYNTVNVKLSNSRLNKLKSAVMFNGNDLHHELFLTQRKITK